MPITIPLDDIAPMGSAPPAPANMQERVKVCGAFDFSLYETREAFEIDKYTTVFARFTDKQAFIPVAVNAMQMAQQLRISELDAFLWGVVNGVFYETGVRQGQNLRNTGIQKAVALATNICAIAEIPRLTRISLASRERMYFIRQYVVLNKTAFAEILSLLENVCVQIQQPLHNRLGRIGGG